MRVFSSGRCLSVFSCDPEVDNVFLNVDERFLVSGSRDKKTDSVEHEHPLETGTFKGHRNYIDAVLIFQRNNIIISAS